MMTTAVKAKFPNRTIFSFEPHEANVAHMCRTLTFPENNFDLSNLYLFNYGAGPKADYSGNQVLMSTKESPSVSYVADGGPVPEIAKINTVGSLPSRIRMLRVDDLMDSLFKRLFPNRDHPVIMKIDVEGYECEVIKGMEEFFKFYDVKFIMMEWQWLRRRCDVPRLFSVLMAKGLRPQTVAGVPLNVKQWKRWGRMNDIVWSA
eukprot:GHVU01070964.1.p1 GENE.GHVU01070964.1~~GHVU01070964.1.p1  ORF type:complete len:204 (-),score=23.28 GHVU01070964.1:282-893(-)